jgi:PKD repeat protein
MLRKLLASLTLCLLFTPVAKATHISGGEIYYHCLGGNQYEITLVVYRDCAGINLNASYNLDITSPCGNKTLTVTTPGGVEISQLCDLELPNSTCNGGNLPGTQEYVYTGTVNLPPCNSWTISWSQPWRNGAIANLVNPGSKNVYVEAKINNVAGPCNDSPRFTNTAIPYVCTGYPVSYSYGTFDPEADSLKYTFISAMNSNAVPLTYTAGFSGIQPITGITLNSSTGQVNFTLNAIGNWVVVVRVDQYNAAGVWIGSVMRDMQFIAYPCSNMPPAPASGTITNLTGDAEQTSPRSIKVCESGDFCFDAVITDPNAGDSLRITTNLQQNLPGATISFSGANPLTCHICWTAAPGSAGFYPFLINVNDGACPIPSEQSYVYAVRVKTGIDISPPATTPESCAGDGDGTATVGVTVGVGPFQYLWSTGETTASITGPAGNYTVIISDAIGCENGPIGVVIGPGGQPATANAGADIVGCPGHLPVQLTGTVQNASGGSWSGGSGSFSGSGLNVNYSPTASEISTGSVSLVLTTSANACGTGTDTVHVDLPTSFTNATITSQNLACPGLSTGSATFTPADPSFTYLWNDPTAVQTTATATNLAAGNYSVHVTDAFGCDTTLSTVISAPAAITISNLAVTHENCAGNGDGSITATVTGGTAPYHYTWSNGDTTAVTHVGAGTYSLSVTDANGCTPATGSATVNALGQPNVAHAGADIIRCFSQLPVQLNGSVTNATSGSWSGGNGTFSNAGLTPTYMPTAAEINANAVDLVLTTSGNTGCPSANDTVHVVLPTSFFGSGITPQNALCHAAATGSATFSPNDPTFTYLWSAAAQSSATANNLAAGNYSLHVTDAFGCDTTLATVISAPAAITITNLAVTHENCAGNDDGSITATVTGGTSPYHYSWSNGDTTAVTHVGAGTYSLSVTDANGCTPATGSATVNALGQPNVAHAGADIIECFSSLPVQLNGSVTHATGGVWSGGAGTFSNAGLTPTYMPTAAEVSANAVDLVLTTSGNPSCPDASDTVHVVLPTSFFGSGITPQNVLCHGASTGTAAFTPVNPTFTYLWNASAQTTATATNLTAGNYSVHVTDVFGCDTTETVVITEPSALTLSASGAAPLCNGGANGTATVSVSGGTPGYAFLWGTNANNQATPTATGLQAGTFTATVTDNNGCSAQASTTLIAPAPITLSAQAPDTVCINSPVQLTAQTFGGTGTLSVVWVGIGTGNTIDHAFTASQIVQVSVTDQAGCSSPTLALPVYVLDLQQATLNTFGDTAFCPGGTATVGALVTGYPGMITYSWPQLSASGSGPFNVTANNDSLLAVTATDACANTLLGQVHITVEIPPTVVLPDTIAQGCAPLTAHFPAGLATVPVTWLWNLGDGTTSNAMTPVHVYTAGFYPVTVTVTTPLGCSATSSDTGWVYAYAPPTAAFSATPPQTDADHPDVQFTDLSAGTPTIWNWDFGDNATSNLQNPLHTYTSTGAFLATLQVSDTHGCSSGVSYPMQVAPIYDITIPNAFSPNPNGGNGGSYDPNDLSNDVFYPFIRYVKDFRMRVFNRWGELVFESDDIKLGWDGWYRGKPCQQDVYAYQVWVRFLDDKEITRLGDLTLFR